MKDTKNDGLKMYTNSGLAVGSIFLTLLIIGGLLLVNYWGNGMKEVKICCVVIGGLWFVGCLFSAPKWYANIEFTQEGLISLCRTYYHRLFQNGLRIRTHRSGFGSINCRQ